MGSVLATGVYCSLISWYASLPGNELERKIDFKGILAAFISSWIGIIAFIYGFFKGITKIDKTE
jgi:hypothetical protein